MKYRTVMKFEFTEKERRIKGTRTINDDKPVRFEVLIGKILNRQL